MGFKSFCVGNMKEEEPKIKPERERGMLKSLINILLWIPLLLIVVPGSFILWLWKSFFEFLTINLLKRNFRPPNNMMDMIMCQGNSYELPNTNAAQVWLLSGTWITAKEFTEHFHKCFFEGTPKKYENLHAHVTTFGSYSFYAHNKPEDLNLDLHIKKYFLKDFGEGTLQSFAVTWMTTNTYEEGRPPWQIAILHLGSKETPETGIVAKFSHALVDGYSFVHMIGKLTGNPAPYLVKDRTLSWRDKLKYIYEAPADVGALYGDMSFGRKSQSPFKKVPTPLQWQMSFVSLDLKAVKLLRRATNTHFISVIISAQYGALRKLLLEKMEEDNMPENLWIGSSMPWPRHPMSLTNHWTMGYFKCPLKMEDPLQRLQAVEAYYKYYTGNELHTKAMFTLAPLVRILPTWARRLVLHYDFALNNVSLFFASLLLSSRKHYLLGREVKNLYLPLACSDVCPAALYGVTTSHSGQIDLSISACNAIVGSQEELDRLTKIYFIEELDAIAAQSGFLGSTWTGAALAKSKV